MAGAPQKPSDVCPPNAEQYPGYGSLDDPESGRNLTLSKRSGRTEFANFAHLGAGELGCRVGFSAESVLSPGLPRRSATTDHITGVFRRGPLVQVIRPHAGRIVAAVQDIHGKMAMGNEKCGPVGLDSPALDAGSTEHAVSLLGSCPRPFPASVRLVNVRPEQFGV